MSRLDVRRRRARLIGAAVLTLPVLELIGIILVGRAVGVLATLLLLLAGGVAGGVVLRRAGAAASRHLLAQSGMPGVPGMPGKPAMNGTPGEPLVVGAPPPEPPVGTALLVPAGLLLLVPGFLSDVAGLVLLVPAVRRALGARLGQAVTRRLNVRAMRSVRIVPGEVVDVQVTDIQVTDVRATDPPATDSAPPRELPPPAPTD